jgi:hypothetical protein
VSSQDVLRQAYHLVKSGDKDAARELLKSLLVEDRDNIDAWWLAAHAAATPQDTRLALCRVLELKPDHQPARLMLDKLNREHPIEADRLPDAVLTPPKRRRTPAQRSRKWGWKVVMVLGLLSFSFASMALISGVLGMTWFEKTVRNAGESIGIDMKPGGRGQLGSVESGDPANPQLIPITKVKPIDPGDVQVGTLNPNEAHLWTFNGKRGQEVTVLVQFTVAGDAHYVLELWDAHNHKLADGIGSIDSGTVTLVYPLIQTGTYSLVIMGHPNGPHGDYALGLDVLTD